MLSIEKLREIEDGAVTQRTFNGLKSLISVYRSVSRASANVNEEEQEEKEHLLELQKATREKAKKKIAKAVQKIRSVKVEYTIEDPAVATKAIDLMLNNIGSLLDHHADGQFAKKASQKSEFVVPGVTEKVGAAPSSYPRFGRVRIIARAFFTETLCLLDQSIGTAGSDVNAHILKFLSDPNNLKWVVPFGRLSERILAHLCRLWMSPVPSIRLAAFMALRSFVAVVGFSAHTSISASAKNAKSGSDGEDSDESNDEAEMGASSSGDKKRLVGVARVDAVIQKMYKALIQSAGKSTTWRGASAMRFGINCMGEILRLNASVAYRAAFQGVRQLALLTRQAVLPNPPKLTDKQKRYAPDGALLTWAFVMGVKIWTHVIAASTAASSSSKLAELAFPLSTVVTAALKLKMTNNDFAPFCTHLLTSLNNLSQASNQYVPTVGFAVTVLNHLSSAVQKARRTPSSNTNSQSKAKGGNNASRLQKGIADVDLLIKLKTEHLSSLQVVESACERVIEVITQSVSILARNPAFPEAVIPIQTILRKAGKTMESDYIRRKVKELVALVDTTAEDIRNQRESISVTRPPTNGQLRSPLMTLSHSSAPELASKYSQLEAAREKRIQEGVSSEESALALEKRAAELEAHRGEAPKGKKAKKEMMKGILHDAKDTAREAWLSKKGGNGVNTSGGNKVFKRNKKFGKSGVKKFKKA